MFVQRCAHALRHKKFRLLLVQAVKVMVHRDYSGDEINAMKVQMAAYQAGLSPFTQPVGDLPRQSAFTKRWWQALLVHPEAKELAELAVFLLKLRPHAADAELCFSAMAYVQSDTRNRLSASNTSRLTMLKMHYTALEQPQ
jgi:hypothetical protein